MILDIQNLSVEYYRRKEVIRAVRNVSFGLEPGESLGIVGESGSGKSTVALSILKLIGKYEGRITEGETYFHGMNISSIPERKMRKIRGRDISMIFQDPFTSLNPVIKIGEQIEEAILVHMTKVRKKNITNMKQEILNLLVKVKIRDPERIYHSYPHQISGGQRQRAMIAMAISNHPKLLIADEPTTALDVTVQKEILDLLLQLKKDLNMSLILITHHMGIVAHYTESLMVMYAGEIVEYGKTPQLLKDPQHPYTRALLQSLPGQSKKNLKIKSKDNKVRLGIIKGSPPDLTQLPTGCIFHPRCEKVEAQCKEIVPKLRSIENENRVVSCHLSPFEPENQ